MTAVEKASVQYVNRIPEWAIKVTLVSTMRRCLRSTIPFVKRFRGMIGEIPDHADQEKKSIFCIHLPNKIETPES